MSTHNVVVLCPNGRRQQIKVTNNSTNLQILEDVCNKQGLKSDEFDLKHYNQILDLTNTVQFSNLPNNAQLELVDITKPRKEQSVNIALQLEDSQRFIHLFLSSCTLWDVITFFQPNHNWNDPSQFPVCVYMRREISGEEELANTTLRSLGLVSGNGVIRLIYKPVGPNVTLKEKQMVDLLSRPGSSRENRINASNAILPSVNEPKAKEIIKSSTDSSMKWEDCIELDAPTCTSANSDRSCPGLMTLSSADIALQLDKRKAYIFSLDDIERVPSFDELPDGFFDLTVADVRILMADLKRKRLALENKILQTSEMREAQDKMKMRKYPETVIRVFFPDRLVLQGNFKATETVADVMSFVRHFLRDSSINFYLYTTPPKQKLLPQIQLVTANLVPGANVYFGSESGLNILRPEMYTHLASPVAANQEAATPRSAIYIEESDMLDEIEQVPIEQPAPIDYAPSHSENTSRKSSSAPKWLKLGKK